MFYKFSYKKGKVKKTQKIMELMEINGNWWKIMEWVQIIYNYWKSTNIEATIAKNPKVTHK